MNKTGRIARVVPVKNKNGATPALGTVILIGDTELACVQRIQLIAEPGENWKAIIECSVIFEDEIQVEADIMKSIRDSYEA